MEMEFLCKSSKLLTKKREISLYGCEEAFPATEDIISKSDAEDAVKRATKIHELCGRLINEIEKE